MAILVGIAVVLPLLMVVAVAVGKTGAMLWLCIER